MRLREPVAEREALADANSTPDDDQGRARDGQRCMRRAWLVAAPSAISGAARGRVTVAPMALVAYAVPPQVRRRTSGRVAAVTFPSLPRSEMISLQRVSKTYKNGVTALTDVDVEVEKGEFVFIVGQSGSGKSTMIRLLILKEEDATKGEHLRGRQEPGARCRQLGRAEAAPQHRHGVPGLPAAARTRPCSRTWRSRWR